MGEGWPCKQQGGGVNLGKRHWGLWLKIVKYTKRVFATIVELDSYEPKAEISENCKAEFDSVYKWFNKPIGYLVDDLYGDKSMYGPDYYRNLIHNIQLYYTKADVSMQYVLRRVQAHSIFSLR